jgi:protein-S-isoprenylcysteine O-methyltransferase Ste14
LSEVKRFSKEILIRKIIAIGLIFIGFYTLMFWLLAPGVFGNPFTLWTIITFYIIGSIDVIIRPIPEGKPEMDRCATVIALMGFVQPFTLILAYYENQLLISTYLAFWNDPIVAYIGLILIIIGGIITIVSRIQLGIFGTPVLVVEEEHQLINTGLYKYLRHPMYSGGILMMIGTFLGFRGLITTISFMVLYFLLVIKRMDREEQMLISAFGENYSNYMKQTKRIIPFIY